MDFSEQDADLFGEDFHHHSHGAAAGAGGGSSGSSSRSSSSGSSDSSSADSSPSSSAGGQGSRGGGYGRRGVGNDLPEGEVGHDFSSYGAPVDEEEDEEDYEVADLFGPDNAAYMNTPASSPFFIPVLPEIQRNYINPNNSQGGFGRGRGPALLPRPGGRHQNGYNSRFSQASRRNDERFVSELRLNKSEETLAMKQTNIQEPCELSCYSRVEGGEVYFDDRNLRLFKRVVNEYVGADLNRGFESFIEKRDLGSEGFGDLLACIRHANIPLQNIHFVTFRNNLNKILAAAYIRNEPWQMGVHKRNGVVYLDVNKLPERPPTERDRRRCYWGYAFENIATENSFDIDEDGRGIDANVEYCSVLKTKLGAHRIIMGAEMDCCDATDDGRRFYVELKTSRELEYHTEEKYEKEKLLKFWIQSFLAGVAYVVIGFRNDAGILVRTERLRTKDITHRVRSKNYWQGGVCLAFADEVLCWLYGTVKENEDYILQFVHPFNRMELLRAQSCPDVITQHVEQLSFPL